MRRPDTGHLQALRSFLVQAGRGKARLGPPVCLGQSHLQQSKSLDFGLLYALTGLHGAKHRRFSVQQHLVELNVPSAQPVADWPTARSIKKRATQTVSILLRSFALFVRHRPVHKHR